MKKFLVVVQCKYSPSKIVFFDSEEEAMKIDCNFQNIEDPYIDTFIDKDGNKHPRGMWLECDPSTCLDNAPGR